MVLFDFSVPDDAETCCARFSKNECLYNIEVVFVFILSYYEYSNFIVTNVLSYMFRLQTASSGYLYTKKSRRRYVKHTRLTKPDNIPIMHH